MNCALEQKNDCWSQERSNLQTSCFAYAESSPVTVDGKYVDMLRQELKYWSVSFSSPVDGVRAVESIFNPAVEFLHSVTSSLFSDSTNAENIVSAPVPPSFVCGSILKSPALSNLRWQFHHYCNLRDLVWFSLLLFKKVGSFLRRGDYRAIFWSSNINNCNANCKGGAECPFSLRKIYDRFVHFLNQQPPTYMNLVKDELQALVVSRLSVESVPKRLFASVQGRLVGMAPKFWLTARQIFEKYSTLPFDLVDILMSYLTKDESDSVEFMFWGKGCALAHSFGTYSCGDLPNFEMPTLEVTAGQIPVCLAMGDFSFTSLQTGNPLKTIISGPGFYQSEGGMIWDDPRASSLIRYHDFAKPASTNNCVVKVRIVDTMTNKELGTSTSSSEVGYKAVEVTRNRHLIPTHHTAATAAAVLMHSENPAVVITDCETLAQQRALQTEISGFASGVPTNDDDQYRWYRFKTIQGEWDMNAHIKRKGGVANMTVVVILGENMKLLNRFKLYIQTFNWLRDHSFKSLYVIVNEINIRHWLPEEKWSILSVACNLSAPRVSLVGCQPSPVGSKLERVVLDKYDFMEVWEAYRLICRVIGSYSLKEILDVYMDIVVTSNTQSLLLPFPDTSMYNLLVPKSVDFIRRYHEKVPTRLEVLCFLDTLVSLTKCFRPLGQNMLTDIITSDVLKSLHVVPYSMSQVLQNTDKKLVCSLGFDTKPGNKEFWDENNVILIMGAGRLAETCLILDRPCLFLLRGSMKGVSINRHLLKLVTRLAETTSPVQWWLQKQEYKEAYTAGLARAWSKIQEHAVKKHGGVDPTKHHAVHSFRDLVRHPKFTVRRKGDGWHVASEEYKYNKVIQEGEENLKHEVFAIGNLIEAEKRVPLKRKLVVEHILVEPECEGVKIRKVGSESTV